MRKQPRAIELPQELRAEALVSLWRFFNENFEERIGNIGAGGRLNFFIEEVGPVIDNKASRMCRNAWLRGFKNLTGNSTKRSSRTGAIKASPGTKAQR